MRTDKKAVAESQGKEGTGSAVAVGKSGAEVVHPHAAGIDVGNSAHYVAVRPDQDPRPCAGLSASPPILIGWLTGSELRSEDRGPAVHRGIGSLCTTFGKNAVSKSIWSTPDTPRIWRDAKRCAGKPVAV